MQSLGDLAAAALMNIGSNEHIPAAEGDFIGEDGLLHCGKCGTKKECVFGFNGHYVPCTCKCREEELSRIEAERKRQNELGRVRELASYSLVDERFRDSTFDKFEALTPEDERVQRICRNYVDNFDKMLSKNVGLLMYGDPGTGKTFAASCIANALMAKGVPVLVTSIVRLTAGMFGDDLDELLDRMNSARLLVLDDFGAERNTEFKAEQIFTVIDARYAAKRPMIITTNLKDFNSETDVRRRRVYDRIFEVCMPVKMIGKSRRFQEGMKRRDDILALLEGL